MCRASPADSPMPGLVVPILFYRSMLLAADVAPIDALFEALRQRAWPRCRSSSSSLKDPASAGLRRSARLPHLKPVGHRHGHRLRHRRRARRRNPVRPRRRAGVPGHRGDDPARGVGKQPARAGAGRPRHARRHARTRRPHPRRRRFRSRPRARPIAALAFRAFANRPEPDRVGAGRRAASRPSCGLQRAPRAERKTARS